MNERINDLMNEAMPTIDWKTRNGVELNNGERLEYMTQWFEKFAELIVEECCDVALKFHLAHPYSVEYQIKKHFGVEE